MNKPEKKLPVPSPAGEGSAKTRRSNRRRRYANSGSKTTATAVKFQGGKEELDGNYFDCTGYGQSDQLMKTVQKMADYIGKEYKGGGVTRTEVMTLSSVTILAPIRPVSTSVTNDDGTVTVTPPDLLDISDYQSANKILDNKIQNQTENRQKVFLLVWQQCTESMHAKIRANRDYKTIEQDLNGIDLLRVMKLICFKSKDKKYVPQKVHETKAAFYALKQGRDSDQAYQIKFMNTVEVIEQCGASLGTNPLTCILVC